ncbi:MAG: hypothetical protein HKP06_09120 [Flavobacteriaceae bacterium]|nr:hypothetical protein [Flavobacteriaceae bacterium]
MMDFDTENQPWTRRTSVDGVDGLLFGCMIWKCPTDETAARNEGYLDNPDKDRLAWRPYPPCV